MKQLQGIYELYRLGCLHRLRSVRQEQKKSSQAYNFIQSFAVLHEFCRTPPYVEMFPASTESGKKLYERVRLLWLDAHKNPDEEISIIDAVNLRTELTQFETLLEHELARLPAYVADTVGIYDVDDLINRADLHLGAEALSQVEDRVREDVRAAGRCLAFGLFTASGFHSVRAVEACARAYHRRVTDKEFEEKAKPLGPIINDLREQLKNESAKEDSPLGLIISTLARVNNLFRKPITHPEMVLDSQDAAKKIFDLAIVAVSQIAEDQAKRLKLKSSP